MGLSYIYLIEYSDEPLWLGTKKWEAQKFLQDEVNNGGSLAEFQVIRMKDARPLTMTEVDVYEFMEIDQGEVF
jgi:hypothetical protein